MINIKYYRENHRVEIVGHAGCGELGHDLVCAAVSSLAYTLAAFVMNLHRAGQITSKSVKLGSGNARIGCRPRREFSASVTLVFDSICGGFELIAREHPEAVSYEIFWGQG